MKFKVGGKVTPHKPKLPAEWPGWYPGMDCYDGKVLTIDKTLNIAGRDFYEIGSWWYSEKWLSLYDEEPFEGNV